MAVRGDSFFCPTHTPRMAARRHRRLRVQVADRVVRPHAPARKTTHGTTGIRKEVDHMANYGYETLQQMSAHPWEGLKPAQRKAVRGWNKKEGVPEPDMLEAERLLETNPNMSMDEALWKVTSRRTRPPARTRRNASRNSARPRRRNPSPPRRPRHPVRRRTWPNWSARR